jgi:Cep192 domain 4/Purple acid Phosphatase, N-terminal domain/Calcineurin-like phosphoesterase
MFRHFQTVAVLLVVTLLTAGTSQLGIGPQTLAGSYSPVVSKSSSPAFGPAAPRKNSASKLGVSRTSAGGFVRAAVSPKSAALLPRALPQSGSPNAPVLFAPSNGANGVTTSPTLDVTVSDSSSNNLTVTFYGRPAATPGADFNLIALPDTQYYSSSLNGGTPAMFNAQTQWIVNNKSTLNIPYVVHLGDIVQTGNNNGNNSEWAVADNALKILENAGIPYGVHPGNHDEGDNLSNIGSASITGSFNTWFGVSRFSGRSYYGGHAGTTNDNHYDLFSAGGLDFIVVYFAYDESASGSRFQNVLTWANGVLHQYPTRHAILVSHYILNNGNPATFGTQGQALFNALKSNPNLFMTLSGHIGYPGEGQRTDTVSGNTIQSVMSDFQDRANGGSGWLRIMTFSPANNRISVQTYSPVLNQYMTDSGSQFTLPFNMQSSGYAVLGTVSNVSSGSHATIPWNSLNTNSPYQWYVTVSNGTNTTTGPVWSFTTTNGTAPAVNLSNTSLNFGSQVVNTSSVAQNVQLTNTGSTALNITSMGVTGTNSGDYSQTNTCGSSVSAGSNCTISVTFKPTATGTRSASVSISDNASGSPHTISLTGTGTTSGPVISGVGASGITTTSAVIGWTTNVQATTQVEYGTSTNYGTLTTLNASLVTTHSQTLSNLLANTNYHYRVRSKDSGNSETISADFTFTTDSTSQPPSAITFIQSASAFSSSATALSKAFNIATTKNNLIVVGVYTWGGTVSSVSDTLANSYLLASSGATPSGNRLYVYYAINKASGADTVTANLSGGGVMSDIHEYAGISTTTPLDQAKVSTGSGTAIDSGGVTTTVANELIFGYAGVDGNVVSGPGATFTQRENTGNGEGSEDKIVSAIGSYNATATGGSATWAGAIVTFAGAGTGSPAPAVNLSASSLIYGSQQINTTSAAQTLTLTNTGTSALHLTTVALGGTNPTAFAVSTGTTCTNGSTVAAGGTCIVNLTFSPSALTSYVATLTFTDDASPTTQVVNLTGTGITSQSILFSPSPLAFGSQQQGTASAALTSTLTNSGSSSVTITGVTITGSNPGDFTFVAPSSGADCRTVGTVAANGTCSIALTFTPAATGARAATVSVADSAAGSPHTLAVTGTGTSTTSTTVSLSPTSLSFSRTRVGSTSSSKSVTLKNTGTSVLNISSIATSGDFSQTNTCGSSRNPGQSCTIRVTFSPTASGTRTGSLTVTDNASNSPQSVSLSGTGR